MIGNLKFRGTLVLLSILLTVGILCHQTEASEDISGQSETDAREPPYLFENMDEDTLSRLDERAERIQERFREKRGTL